MKPGIVIAIQWQHNACSLLTYNDGYSSIDIKLGQHISFQVMPGRYCVGYTTLSKKNGNEIDSWKTYKPCPENAQILLGRQCQFCSSIDIMKSCLRCVGSTCNAHPSIMRECKKNEATVYLAAFEGKKIKAGVSKALRVKKRWVEQGADIALRVLKGNGYEVRQYEQEIQKKFSLLNSVPSFFKRMPLTDVKGAQELLGHLRDKIHAMYPKVRLIYEEPELLAPVYHLPEFKSVPLNLPVKDRLKVSGKILGVKGPILYLEMCDLVYTLNLSRLIARRIQKLKEPIRSQSSIDRYFR